MKGGNLVKSKKVISAITAASLCLCVALAVNAPKANTVVEKRQVSVEKLSAKEQEKIVNQNIWKEKDLKKLDKEHLSLIVEKLDVKNKVENKKSLDKKKMIEMILSWQDDSDVDVAEEPNPEVKETETSSNVKETTVSETSKETARSQSNRVDSNSKRTASKQVKKGGKNYSNNVVIPKGDPNAGKTWTKIIDRPAKAEVSHKEPIYGDYYNYYWVKDHNDSSFYAEFRDYESYQNALTEGHYGGQSSRRDVVGYETVVDTPAQEEVSHYEWR